MPVMTEQPDRDEAPIPEPPAGDLLPTARTSTASQTDPTFEPVDERRTSPPSTKKEGTGNRPLIAAATVVTALIALVATLLGVLFMNLNSQIQGLGVLIQESEERVTAQIRETEERLTARIVSLEERVSRLEMAMAEVLVRLSSLEAAVASLETRMSSLEERVAAIERFLRSEGIGFVGVQASAELEERVSAIESFLRPEGGGFVGAETPTALATPAQPASR